MQIIVNGITVNYTDEGRGVPLLFVHGFPFSRGAWQKQIDALRSSYRVIAPDLRGFGESEAGTGAVAMEQYAGDLHAMIQQLTTGPVVLIGHSMGGYVSFAFPASIPRVGPRARVGLHQGGKGFLRSCRRATSDSRESAGQGCGGRYRGNGAQDAGGGQS